jgi:putative hydrolase of the HAD superfamily
MSTKIRGIFFDAGNTLLRVHPSVGAVYAEAAKRYGADLSVETIEESFQKMWMRTAPLVTNQGHRLSYEKERDWWRFIVGEVFHDHIQFENFEAFFDYLFERFAQSNWDSRLPSLLDQLEISQYFKTVVVSALVGYEKPHPAIFEIALQQSGLQNGEIIYIGDDPVLDYQAARTVGIRAYHLDRHKKFESHEDRIDCLKEVISRI